MQRNDVYLKMAETKRIICKAYDGHCGFCPLYGRNTIPVDKDTLNMDRLVIKNIYPGTRYFPSYMSICDAISKWSVLGQLPDRAVKQLKEIFNLYEDEIQKLKEKENENADN